MADISLINKIAIAPIKLYQKFSKFTPASCRYYPSCSEFARQQFLKNDFISASKESALRILRCNQFFAGGIDYPKINFKKPKKIYFNKNKKIAWWIVPITTTNAYLIKAF